MNWDFEYLGVKDGSDYFCIKMDDGKGNGQGVSTRFHYYKKQEDESIQTLNYMQIPNFKEKPSKKEATVLMDKTTRFFNGWIPYNMKVVNP